MTCPCCESGRVRMYRGFMCEDGFMKLGYFVVCESCPWASEYNTTDGTLEDAGQIPYLDLLNPYREDEFFFEAES